MFGKVLRRAEVGFILRLGSPNRLTRNCPSPFEAIGVLPDTFSFIQRSPLPESFYLCLIEAEKFFTLPSFGLNLGKEKGGRGRDRKLKENLAQKGRLVGNLYFLLLPNGDPSLPMREERPG